MVREAIRNIIKRGLSVIAAMLSLVSGMFWHISAKKQMDALDASVEAARKLTELSIQFNVWAAYVAVITGICLACALYFED
ncbi:hypothetical protein K5D37_15175 [Pseudomonas cichorii]|nr:hypothetical protein [Pseudomonas cichorii]